MHQISVSFPRMKELLAVTGNELHEHAAALRRMITLVYGDRHWALDARQRQNRATLNKLANLIDQLELVEDLALHQLGYGCPAQIRKYYQSLRETVPVAYYAGIDKRTLVLVEEVHERNWQIMNEVTLLFDGLS